MPGPTVTSSTVYTYTCTYIQPLTMCISTFHGSFSTYCISLQTATLCPQDRQVVVREPSGVLREGTWEERDRMMHVYFPSLGRKMWLPHMLTEEGLIPVLEEGWYGDILERVCLQFEPNSSDYIRVSISTSF